MTINSGSNKEDSEIRGLAHFCEHLLFLGSKKYPKATHFIDFVSKNSGKFNGFTDFENTAFFFEINDKEFEEGLDIFANNFISPLLSEQYIEKEVNSINSEFEKNLQNDKKRKDSILRDIANEHTLLHRFTTGNLITLIEDPTKKKIVIQEMLRNYFERNYTPENMKLIIYGDRPVQDYIKMTERIFQHLTPKNSLQTKYSADMTKLPWEFGQMGKLVLYQTLNSHQDFEINIMIDDVFDSFPNNYILYFKTLFNYRGEGSIFDILRSKGLMKSIKSRGKKVYKGFSFLKIVGYITEEGIKNLDSVIGYIYSYIHNLKELSRDKKLYDYIKKSMDIAFNFKSGNTSNALSLIKNLTRSLWKYDKKYIIAQHKLLADYNEEGLAEFYRKISLHNSIIIVGNNLFDKHMMGKYSSFVENFQDATGETDIFTKSNEFYNARYCDFNLKRVFIDKIENPKLNTKSDEISKQIPSFHQMDHLPQSHISLERTCNNIPKKKVS